MFDENQPTSQHTPLTAPEIREPPKKRGKHAPAPTAKKNAAPTPDAAPVPVPAPNVDAAPVPVPAPDASAAPVPVAAPEAASVKANAVRAKLNTRSLPLTKSLLGNRAHHGNTDALSLPPPVTPETAKYNTTLLPPLEPLSLTGNANSLNLSTALLPAPEGGVAPRFVLAKRMAAGLTLLFTAFFFFTAWFIYRSISEIMLTAIIQDGVNKCRDLTEVGKTILENSADPQWPVKLDLISAHDFELLKAHVSTPELTNEEITLFAAQRGGLLRSFIMRNVGRNLKPTSTLLAYVTDSRLAKFPPKNLPLYDTFGFIAARAELDADLPPQKQGVWGFTPDAWLPKVPMPPNAPKNLEIFSAQLTAAEKPAAPEPLPAAAPPTAPTSAPLSAPTAGEAAPEVNAETKLLIFQLPIYASLPGAKTQTRIGFALVGLNASTLIASQRQARWELFLAGVGFVLFTSLGVYGYVFFKVVQRLRTLLNDMQIFGRGTLSHRSAAVKDNDEIGWLAKQLNQLAENMSVMIADAAKNAHILNELSVAKEIQNALLPTASPKIPGYDFAKIYNPAKEVGGDYFDYFPIDEEHTGIIVADVSGKGVPGSIVMTTTRTILRFLAKGNISAADTLKRANAIISADIRRGMFVTAFYLVLNHRAHTFNCASAGHTPMILMRTDGNYELINPSGIALGFDKGKIFNRTIAEQTVKLNLGDRVVLYTDGVIESTNLYHEEYTEERFIDFVKNYYPLSSAEFVNELTNELEHHRAGRDLAKKKAEQHDDITVVTFRA
jgi:serine phosphatase RsbU (regulator of sigma subunit)